MVLSQTPPTTKCIETLTHTTFLQLWTLQMLRLMTLRTMSTCGTMRLELGNSALQGSVERMKLLMFKLSQPESHLKELLDTFTLEENLLGTALLL